MRHNSKVGISARSIALLAFCFSISAGSSAKTKSVIILFGDSITAGSPYTSGNIGGKRIGPVQQELESLLKESNRDVVVLNFGWSGTTTKDALRRLDTTLTTAKSLEPAKQYYLAMMYGTNDVGVGIPPNQTKINIELIIDIARDANVTPIIGTPKPKRRTHVWSLESYVEAIKSAARGRNALIVDHFSAWPIGNYTLLTKDGLHPNREGYSYISNTWYRTFEILIKPKKTAIKKLPAIINILLD